MKMILRLLGVTLLLFGMVALVVDSTKTLSANGDLVVTSFGTQWLEVNADSFYAARTAVQDKLHPFIWNPIISTFLLWPTWVLFGGLGILFYWIGRKRYKIDLYAN